MSSSSIVYAGAFLAAIAPAINSVPTLIKAGEVRVFPVVVNMEAHQIPSPPHEARYLVTGDKVRNCEFINAQGYSRQEGVAMKSALTFADDPSPNSSRPKGVQNFGEFRFSLEDQPNASEVFALITHDCGLWRLTTTLGPWEVK